MAGGRLRTGTVARREKTIPEPQDVGPTFTPEALGRRLAGRDVPLKALLCDQALVADIGNIYAAEVLFLAKVHPLTRGRAMSRARTVRLHEAIVDRMTTASEGAPCGRCGGTVSSVPVRGRSTYFCPDSQTK